MGYAREPSSRRSSAPHLSHSDPAGLTTETSHPRRRASLKSGLTAAVLAFALGRLIIPSLHLQITKAGDWWGQHFWNLMPSDHSTMGASIMSILLSIPIGAIGVIVYLALSALMIVTLVGTLADHFYVFPVLGFLIGMGAGGPVGRALSVPINTLGTFLVVVFLSIFDFFRYPKLSHRMASLAVLALGVGVFVVGGKVFVPLAQRGAAPPSPGQEVIRYLPGKTWVTERGDHQWHMTLTEASLHKDFLELTVLAQNASRRIATLGVNPKTDIVYTDSSEPFPTNHRVRGVEGNIPMAPAIASVNAGEVSTMRLRFPRPLNPEHLWHLNLHVVYRVSKGNAFEGAGCGLDFDLRQTKEAPRH